MGTEPKGRPFVVTGCGRSGTKYTAQLLSAAGVPCSHEGVFTGRIDDPMPIHALIADSSWLAAPFLHKLPPSALILHQTRNPLAVVTSYVARGFFDQQVYERPIWKHFLKRILRRPPSGQYRLISLVREVLPQVFSERTPVRRAAKFWIDWNSLVEREARSLGLEYLTYRVEEIGTGLLTSLVGRITGNVMTAMTARAALEKVPTNVNTGPKRTLVSLDELGSVGDELVAKATSYGYKGLERANW